MHNHLLSLPKTTSRCLLLLMSLLMLLVAAQPAQAEKYTFSGGLLPILGNNLPPGCHINSLLGLIIGNTYNCGALTLADSDTVTIIDGPITINFSAIFNTGAAQINVGGKADNLNLVLAGALNVGISAKVVANVTDTAAITLGANSEVSGTITATSSTGVVSTGDSSRVGGTIFAELGAITIGSNGTVNGDVIAKTGVVTTGANSQVYGKVEADIGAINVGISSIIHGVIIAPTGAVTIGATAQVKGNVIGGLGAVTTGIGAIISGNITTNAGVVTIGADNTVGDIITDAGGITVGNGSTVGTVSSPVGVITILNNVTVLCDVKSGAGAVNIESSSRICGDLIINGAGVLTLTTGIKIGGNVSTAVGAMTIGADTAINGDVFTTGSGVITVTSALIGGKIATVDGAITVTGSHVGGTIRSSGVGVVTITGSIWEDATLVVPPACGTILACGALPPPPPTPGGGGSTATGLFDCLATESSTASFPLYTKLAGTDFKFDIVALKTTTTGKIQNSNYVAAGDPPKYTRVELFDDPDEPMTITPAICTSYINPLTFMQTATFTSSSLGRASTGYFNVPHVYKKLRCRVTECTNSTCTTLSTTPDKQSCSSDQFSVRPTNFTVTSTTATADNTGTSGTAKPVIKAGAYFNLTATSVAGYTGTPLIDDSKLLAHSGAVTVGRLTGSFAAANVVTGIASNSSFAYSEVGYFALDTNGVYDNTFTTVDISNNDCTADFSNVVNNEGKYGCNFGNSGVPINYFGRFIPDHFVLTPGTAVPACGTFSYFGQDGLTTTFTMTAQNASNGTTLNYVGNGSSGWAKLPLTFWSKYGFAASGWSPSQPGGASLVASATPPTATNANTWASGVTTIIAKHQIIRSTSPAAPTTVNITALPIDTDGVTMPAAVNVATSTLWRYGRLSLQNAYGSELLDLPIPVTAQYWNGSSFVTNDLDSCTTLADSNIGYGNYQAPLTAINIGKLTFRTADINGSCSASSVPSGVIISGKSCILLSKPTAPVTGSADLLINLGSITGNCLSPALSSGSSAGMAYLSGNWCGTSYDRDPTAHINLGLYKDNGKGHRIIYLREVY